jgi:hypothetical protein
MPNPFPNPPQPYSLEQIIAKILSDSDYAQFIQDQIIRARGGDAEAQATVDANFEPQTAELDALGIPTTDQSIYARCTDTKTALLAVAAYVQTP